MDIQKSSKLICFGKLIKCMLLYSISEYRYLKKQQKKTIRIILYLSSLSLYAYADL